MRFARWVFMLAGVTGVLMIVPPFFMEAKTGEDYPPPINHPEFYYGFFGVALAWQWMFLIIASDPVRYRPAMLPAMLEKASFAIVVPILYAQGRVGLSMLGASMLDALWLVLFVWAYWRTGKSS